MATTINVNGQTITIQDKKSIKTIESIVECDEYEALAKSVEALTQLNVMNATISNAEIGAEAASIYSTEKMELQAASLGEKMKAAANKMWDTIVDFFKKLAQMISQFVSKSVLKIKAKSMLDKLKSNGFNKGAINMNAAIEGAAVDSMIDDLNEGVKMYTSVIDAKDDFEKVLKQYKLKKLDKSQAKELKKLNNKSSDKIEDIGENTSYGKSMGSYNAKNVVKAGVGAYATSRLWSNHKILGSIAGIYTYKKARKSINEAKDHAKHKNTLAGVMKRLGVGTDVNGVMKYLERIVNGTEVKKFEQYKKDIMELEKEASKLSKQQTVDENGDVTQLTIEFDKVQRKYYTALTDYFNMLIMGEIRIESAVLGMINYSMNGASSSAAGAVSSSTSGGLSGTLGSAANAIGGFFS